MIFIGANPISPAIITPTLSQYLNVQDTFLCGSFLFIYNLLIFSIYTIYFYFFK
nr:MAG TPA: hypothetical protein [Caudoviricetes sp.]